MQGETATAHASTLRTMTAVTLSGRHPNVRVPSVGLRRLAFRKVGCDAATRVWHASYHFGVVVSDVLLGSELSEQSSSVRHGRLHSSDSPDMLQQNWTPQLVCAQPGAGACPFCAAHFLLCGAGLAQLGRELVQVPLRFLLSVGGAFLKKSASVVAKDATLMVTVLTCFSITAVLSRVSLVASLQTVLASVASWHFCSSVRLVSVCHSRA